MYSHKTTQYIYFNKFGLVTSFVFTAIKVVKTVCLQILALKKLNTKFNLV